MIGTKLWTNKELTIFDLPKELKGSTLFQTKYYLGSSTICVHSNKDDTVFVALNSRQDGGLIDILPLDGWTLIDDLFVQSKDELSKNIKLDKIWWKKIDQGKKVSFTSKDGYMIFAIFVKEGSLHS